MAIGFESCPDDPDALCLSGAWTLDRAAELERALGQAPAARRIDAGAIERLDSAGAWLLLKLARRLGVEDDAIVLPPKQRDLFAAVRTVEDEAPPPVRHGFGWVRLLERTGAAVANAWQQSRTLLGFLGLTLATLGRTLRHPRRLRVTATVHHMEQTGLDAVPLVLLLSFLVGAVVAFLGATVLEDFGAQIFVVELVSYSFLREFGVLLTAILLAGRTASAFTAQIGAMKSREEIDAIRTLGLDPIELLVLPRLIALVLMLPLLSFLATLAGFAGGLAVTTTALGFSVEWFLTRLDETVELRHLLVGLSKAPIFASVIALIGCVEGFKVAGTAQSVGERTTSSVVQSIFLVILIDAIAAVFFMEMDW